MKKFFTYAAVALMLAVTAQPMMQAQTRRPGQTTTVRPGNNNNNNKDNNRHNNKNDKNKKRPGQNPSAVTRPGLSNSIVKRPGQPTRPTAVRPPVRPNRLPSYSWTRPVRPNSWRPTNVSFNKLMLGLNFGVTISNSLNFLNSSNYSVDGYDTDCVYLRNVTEMNYRWDDATLYYANGYLTQSRFYDSSIGYNTSAFYRVMNYIKKRYGQPATVSNRRNSLNATWFGPGNEYITLEYRMLNASSGYRYYTILTIGE